MFNNIFPNMMLPLWDNVEKKKYGKSGQATDDKMRRREHAICMLDN